MREINLTNGEFGRLFVVGKEYDMTRKKGVIYWKCICRCDKRKRHSIRGDNLRGGTQSCGCLQKEIAANLKRKSHHHKRKVRGRPLNQSYVKKVFRDGGYTMLGEYVKNNQKINQLRGQQIRPVQ